MNDIKMTNIPSMAVGKMVNQLSEAYSTVINNGFQSEQCLPLCFGDLPVLVNRRQFVRLQMKLAREPAKVSM